MVRDWTVRGLKQAAVYWAPGAEDGYGRITPVAAVEIRCHWSDSQQEVRGRTGEQLISDAQVITDRDVEEGGFLFLGTLADAAVEGSDPHNIDMAHKILKAGSAPTFRGKLKVSSAWL